tara:strand:+ start:80 stop:307 length:228 start_codon:yes stop_codon:yes gene_type:complete
MEKRAKTDSTLHRIETAVKRIEKAIEKKESSVSLDKKRNFEASFVKNNELSETNKIIERRLNGAIKSLKEIYNDM